MVLDSHQRDITYIGTPRQCLQMRIFRVGNILPALYEPIPVSCRSGFFQTISNGLNIF
jgi:hypothetical protein